MYIQQIMCLKSILFLMNRDQAQKLKSVKHSSHFQKIVNHAKIHPYPLINVKTLLTRNHKKKQDSENDVFCSIYSKHAPLSNITVKPQFLNLKYSRLIHIYRLSFKTVQRLFYCHINSLSFLVIFL